MVDMVLPSYAQKIGLQNCHALRKMTTTSARRWLKSKFELTEDELTEALKLAQPDHKLAAGPDVTSPIQAELKRIGIAAMWLCGVSQRQLAKLHRVAPQTISQKLERLFKEPAKQTPRIHDEMEFWRADLMLETWQNIATPEVFALDFYDVAKMLDSATPTTDPEADNDARTVSE